MSIEQKFLIKKSKSIQNNRTIDLRIAERNHTSIELSRKISIGSLIEVDPANTDPALMEHQSQRNWTLNIIQTQSKLFTAFLLFDCVLQSIINCLIEFNFFVCFDKQTFRLTSPGYVIHVYVQPVDHPADQSKPKSQKAATLILLISQYSPPTGITAQLWKCVEQCWRWLPIW